MWKTTDFPAAEKGYQWSVVLQVLLGEFVHFLQVQPQLHPLPANHLSHQKVVFTAAVQLLLWRDRRTQATSGGASSLTASESSAGAHVPEEGRRQQGGQKKGLHGESNYESLSV